MSIYVSVYTEIENKKKKVQNCRNIFETISKLDISLKT